MLQVFFGNDTHEVRQAAWAAAQAASIEAPMVVASDGYEPGQLAELVSSGSLFREQRTVIIDTPTDVLADELPPLLDAMAASSDTYIIIEGALLAAAKKQYAKHTKELSEFKAAAAERFNTFALADALAKRNKKQLWLLLQQATQAGIPPEEVAGVLWWQLKSIRLAALTNSAKEADMKDFPYRKAKQALGTLPLPEAERLSHELLTIYHQGHAGEVELATALEQWVLTL
ncbi:hypothetical protein CL655_02110 [bacterium]|nr:hypothetical protein [bacterium]|tara:strand:+ start:1280 stop:1969 length:690 start_codon:yes stop_codon:yes gene_type:complete